MSFFIKPNLPSIIPRKGHDPTLISLYSNASKVNLKHVKRVLIDFDPFDERTKSIRDLFFYITSKRIKKTNVECVIKANINCIRNEPTLQIKLANGHNLLYKTSYLSAFDVLDHLNQYLSKLEQSKLE